MTARFESLHIWLRSLRERPCSAGRLAPIALSMDTITQQRLYDLMQNAGPEIVVERVLSAALFAAQDGLHPNGGAKWHHPPECTRITNAVFGKDGPSRLRFERRVHKHLRNMLASGNDVRPARA